MLSTEENALLTQVSAGTPMGEMLRSYWLPALLAEEVAEPAGDPVPLKILGQDLVAFRDSEGRLGLLDGHCAHRCADLSYGRNEQGGLRCLYHGWKYDVEGRVLETPNEPASSQLKAKVRQPSYPVFEAGGVIWAYLGNPANVPPHPPLRWAQAPASHRAVAKIRLQANYLQVVEGGVDSSHVGFLHRTGMAALEDHPVTKTDDLAMLTGDTAPTLEVQPSCSGFQYAAIRRVDDGHNYVRITTYTMPWYTTVPHLDSVPQQTQGYVPIDDENTWFWEFWIGDEPLDVNLLKAFQGADRLNPDYSLTVTRDNHHLQDRQAMRRGSWSGLRGIMVEDSAMTEGMGAIVDRSREHLGVNDVAVIRVRRQLLDAVKGFCAGQEPPGRLADLPIGKPYAVATPWPKDRPWRELGAIAEFV